MHKLRDYQLASLETVWPPLLKFDPIAALLSHATGTGKSHLVATLCRWLVRNKRRVLVLSHVKELLEQDAAKLALIAGDEVAFGFYCAGLDCYDTDQSVIFGSVQSVSRHVEDLGRFDVVLIDEAHLVSRKAQSMYGKVLAALREDNPNLHLVGLTATPHRLDSGRLDQGPDALFNTIAHEYSIAQGIRDEWLCPLISKDVEDDARIDVRGVAKRGGEYVQHELQAAANQHELVSNAVSEIIEQAKKKDRRSWLAFCSGVEHAYAVAAEMRASGIDAETVVGDTPADERADIFRRFRKGKIRCLTGVNVFSVGFNIKRVDLIVLLRPTCSTGLYVQQVGRGTRPHKDKDDCLVLDFAGNVWRHGPVDDLSIQTKSAGGGNGQAPIKKCPNCRTLVSLGTRECPDCGYEWPKPELKHSDKASEAPILNAESGWVSVLSVKCSKYKAEPRWDQDDQKIERPALLKVEFLLDMPYPPLSIWIAIGNPSAHRFVYPKWRMLGGRDPLPRTVEDALSRSGEIDDVDAIKFRPQPSNPRFMEITNARFRAAA
jgi:DNA repair protein RadD